MVETSSRQNHVNVSSSITPKTTHTKTTIMLVIKGQPIAKGRPCFSMHSGYPTAYTPMRTRLAESSIREQAASQLPSDFVPLSGPLSIKMDFFMKRPKSLKKSVVHHTKRPDCENLVKTVLDALNSVAYDDDSQVTAISASKSYGTPGMVITIEELE